MATKPFYDRRELTLRVPGVREFWVNVTAGRYDGAAQIYSVQSDWDRRTHVLGLAGAVPADSPIIDSWLTERPGHPLPLTAKGLHAVGWAWQARTDARAEKVSSERFDEFHRRLRVAEDLLVAAAKVDPKSPIPWAGLLDTGRGLQISRQEVEYRMEEMAARYPLYSGFGAYLQFVCEKWFGSHEQMWEFADSVNDAAPVGSPLHAVQADAAIERFLHRSDLISPKRALQAEGRLEPLLRAADRSVLHVSFDPDSPAGIRALSSFVMAFERYGCRRLNHHLIPMLRKHWLAEYPSCYFPGAFGHTTMWRRLSSRYRVTGLRPARRTKVPV